MSIERARKHLSRWGKDTLITEHELSSATVELAAEALGTEAGRIAKTLSFLNGERTLLVVAAGDARIDSAKFKKTFGLKKARMVPAEEVEPRTGHSVGGVCPFGLPEPLPVYCDLSLKAFATVVPAAGATNAAVILTPDRLAEITDAVWADLCEPMPA